MASFAAFTDGAEVMQRELSVSEGSNIESSRIHEVYEIERCIKWITDNSFSQIALQFPDELLGDSANVINELQKLTNVNYFILGDTSYGSCCVDVVAAQHNHADCLIHFGRSCLSSPKLLPVLYVFTQLTCCVKDFFEKITTVLSNTAINVLILYDVRYHHVCANLELVLKKYYAYVNMPILNAEFVSLHDKTVDLDNFKLQNEESHLKFRKLGRTFNLKPGSQLEDYTVVYIGEEGVSLNNWITNLNKCKFYSYNPKLKEARQETFQVNKMLMKRYYMIERAKDASIIGIMAGTLGIKDNLEIIKHIKTLIKQAGKKSYTFVVGKLNIAKLANFAEIDLFVLVSCPENTLIDSSEFYKPIITPFELEVACNQARSWTGDYYTDFGELLPGAAAYVEIANDGSTYTDVSLVTGLVRTLGVGESTDSATSTEIQQRNENHSMVHTAGEFLSERSWQGLEEKLGETKVEKAVEGIKGIAASYQHEPS